MMHTKYRVSDQNSLSSLTTPQNPAWPWLETCGDYQSMESYTTFPFLAATTCIDLQPQESANLFSFFIKKGLNMMSELKLGHTESRWLIFEVPWKKIDKWVSLSTDSMFNSCCVILLQFFPSGEGQTVLADPDRKSCPWRRGWQTQLEIFIASLRSQILLRFQWR